MSLRKWRKDKDTKEREKKQKQKDKLDRAFKKRMQKGYDEGLAQNLRTRVR